MNSPESSCRRSRSTRYASGSAGAHSCQPKQRSQARTQAPHSEQQMESWPTMSRERHLPGRPSRSYDAFIGLRSSASRSATRERVAQHDRFGSRKHEVDLLRLDADDPAAAPHGEPFWPLAAFVEHDVIDEAFVAERRPDPVALAVAKPIAIFEKCRWGPPSGVSARPVAAYRLSFGRPVPATFTSILYVSKRPRKADAAGRRSPRGRSAPPLRRSRVTVRLRLVCRLSAPRSG